MTTRLSLAGREADVQQTLAYRVAYERLDHFLVDVPRIVADSQTLQFLCRGEETAKSKEAAEKGSLLKLDFAPARREENGSDADTVLLRVGLPKARIGKVELLVRYTAGLSPWTAGEGGTVTVPLVMPADDAAVALSSNRLTVAAPAGLRVESAASPWQSADRDNHRPSAEDSSEWTAADRTGGVELTLRADAAEDAARGDRRAGLGANVADALHPPGPRGVPLQLQPEGDRILGPCRRGGGEDVRGPRRQSRQSSIGGREPDGDCTAARREPAFAPLGIAVLLPRSAAAARADVVRVAALGHEAWTRRLYWQLMLPADEHVIATPSGFTSEYAWKWTTGFIGRKPLLAQDDLERWIGARTAARSRKASTAISTAHAETSSKPRCGRQGGHGSCCWPRARPWWPACC